MHIARHVIVLLSVAAIPLNAGCYRYAPIEAVTAQPGSEVRVRLSTAESQRLRLLVGADNRRLVAGTLVENSPAGIVVEVSTRVPGDFGLAMQTLSQRVRVMRAEIIELESRQLDHVRTGVLVGGLAAIAAGTALRAGQGDGSSARLPVSGSSEIRMMLFRFVPWWNKRSP